MDPQQIAIFKFCINKTYSCVYDIYVVPFGYSLSL